MGIISIENTDRLYWLGRYTERVYTTIGGYAKNYDSMLDVDFDSYAKFCDDIDIPNIYKDKEDFIKRYCYDENDPNSICSNLLRAYDNAIVLREEIGSEPLSYIQLAVYAMNKAKISDAPMIELQKVVDNILAFWGIADDLIESQNVRNIIKVGKRVERIDIYARVGVKRRDLVREVNRLKGRIKSTILDYDEEKLEHISKLVNQEDIDYYRVVYDVETFIR